MTVAATACPKRHRLGGQVCPARAEPMPIVSDLIGQLTGPTEDADQTNPVGAAAEHPAPRTGWYCLTRSSELNLHNPRDPQRSREERRSSAPVTAGSRRFAPMFINLIGIFSSVRKSQHPSLVVHFIKGLRNAGAAALCFGTYTERSPVLRCELLIATCVVNLIR